MFDELRHLVLIATHGTFTEAARQAHLSQPALSASVARLEESVGARLLHRGAGGTRLTAAGEALLPRARAALAAVEEGRRAVEEVMGLRAGEVRVGAGATIVTYYLPPILSRFRKAHPGVVLKLRELVTYDVAQALETGDLDLGLVPATYEKGEPWRRDELILVGARGVSRNDVEAAPFVTFPPGSSTRDLLARNFPAAHVVMELSGIGAILAFVRAGAGVALVSRIAVAADLARGTLVELRHPKTPVIRELSLVHRGVDRLSPAAAALRARLLAR